MSLRINQNIAALETYRTVSSNASRLEASIQKLSSGMRINNASDDAAGLAISEKMRRQIRGLNRAVHNSQDGISMLQTAEGAINESQNILQRMRELAIQSANDTLTSADRLEIQKEVDQLKTELNRIATSTEFNTKKLLNGSQTALMSLSTNAVRGFVVGNINGGGTYSIEVETLKGGVSEMQRSQIFTVRDSEGKLADGNTQLQSISQFYDTNGVFALDSAQSITLYGNGKSTEVVVDGHMSLDNLAASIQNAISRDAGLGIKNTKVSTIATAQTKIANLGGYLQVISGSIGAAGTVTFSSDNKLMDSLGMGVAREAVEGKFKLTAAKDGSANSINTESDRARGLLDGIDLQFTSQAANVAATQGMQEGLLLSAATSGDLAFKISAGGKSVDINIAQGYWTMEGLIRNLNSQFEAAKMTGLRASLTSGEVRLSFERPVSVSTSIPNTIVINDATDGAKTLGFISGTFDGFVDAEKDQEKVRWGFSTFVEKDNVQSLKMSVGDGVANFTIEVATTSSKGTADMHFFGDFQVDFNKLAKTNSVKVRVDQVGTVMVFTSLRVGTERVSGEKDIESRLTLNFNATAVGTAEMQHILGLENNTVARGSGDTNFNLYVVDKRTQLQTGADQGHTLKFAIAEMTAEALELSRIDVSTLKGASQALSDINKAIDKVSRERSQLGALQNRLEFAINNMRNTHSNLSASESRIRDTDIALEMVEFTRNQIVSQSGTAMLAQANMSPQSVLQLLR